MTYMYIKGTYIRIFFENPK